MASVNKVILLGNLGRDPETRYTTGGDAVTNLNIATSEQWKDKSGEKQERTEWHRVVLFGRQAEIAGEYLKKGRSVYIEGRLQTRKYTDKDGVEKYSTEIVADRMQLIGGRASRRRRRRRRVRGRCSGGGGGARREGARRRRQAAPPAGQEERRRLRRRHSVLTRVQRSGAPVDAAPAALVRTRRDCGSIARRRRGVAPPIGESCTVLMRSICSAERSASRAAPDLLAAYADLYARRVAHVRERARARTPPARSSLAHPAYVPAMSSAILEAVHLADELGHPPRRAPRPG